MFKLLINKGGNQVVEVVHKSGGYVDMSAVMWDERTDGDLPAITLGGMVRQGNALVFDQARKDQHDTALLPQKKAEKIAELNAAYNVAIHADILHNSKTFAADEDRLNLISRFSSLNAVPTGMYFEAIDGEQVPMTLTQLRALGSAMAARGLAEHQNLTTKKSVVNAATTISEIDSVIY